MMENKDYGNPSTYSTQGNISGEDILKNMEEAKKLLDKLPPRCVIVFSDQLKDDAIFQGGWVDEMLGCNKNERGFIVSESKRAEVSLFGNNIRIVDMKTINPFYQNFKDVPIEVREPKWGVRS